MSDDSNDANVIRSPVSTSESTDEIARTAAAVPSAARGRMLVVVSSPSGGGKGTLIRRLMERVPDLGYSVSWTTRAPRPGEIDGVHYHFVSPEEFTSMRERGEFLESAIVHNNFYGTAWRGLEAGGAAHDVILEIDVQGAQVVRERIRDAVHVFILPPSYAVLRERLERRGSESATDLLVRLHNAAAEVACYGEFDYVVLNDDVEAATERLAAIIIAERSRSTRQHTLANNVLASFPHPST